MAKHPLRNRLRVFRAERGYTQFQTADRAKMSRYRYQRIESGDLEPRETERTALARVFGVPADNIFTTEVTS